MAGILENIMLGVTFMLTNVPGNIFIKMPIDEARLFSSDNKTLRLYEIPIAFKHNDNSNGTYDCTLAFLPRAAEPGLLKQQIEDIEAIARYVKADISASDRSSNFTMSGSIDYNLDLDGMGWERFI